MQNITRKAVHHLFKTFAQQSLQAYDVEKLKRAYPFHRLFFDELGLVAAKQERSIVTKMGQSLYPELARLVAIEKYSDVVLEKTIDGNLNAAMVIGLTKSCVTYGQDNAAPITHKKWRRYSVLLLVLEKNTCA